MQLLALCLLALFGAGALDGRARTHDARETLLCEHFVAQSDVQVRRLLASFPDVSRAQRTLCSEAGIRIAKAEAGGAAIEPLEALLNARWLDSVLLDDGLIVVPPVNALRVERVPLLHSKSAKNDSVPLWRVSFDSGSHAWVDTGSDRTIVPSAARREGPLRTFLLGTPSGERVIRGWQSEAALASGTVRVANAVHSSDVEIGLLGRDALAGNRGTICFNWAVGLVRLGPCNDSLEVLDRAKLYINAIGEPLVELRDESGAPIAFAHIDTGTLVSFVQRADCHGSSLPTVQSDALRHDWRADQQRESLVYEQRFVMGGGVQKFSEHLICETVGAHEGPRPVLGMSFLNRFSAIEFDWLDRTLTIYK